MYINALLFFAETRNANVIELKRLLASGGLLQEAGEREQTTEIGGSWAGKGFKTRSKGGKRICACEMTNFLQMNHTLMTCQMDTKKLGNLSF